MLCLREASLGPVFGIKGGAAGGGYAQVVPMEDLNLHFTGDIHAIGAANNLLAAMLEAHLLHGNALGIDPLSIGWRRCVDINDRALRDVAIGLGGRANGYVRETGFDITAASEVMAIVAVARDLHDLRERARRDHRCVHVRGRARARPSSCGAAGAMAVLLKDALKPNLVQTLEGQPALVHCGPFANIAHGNNSLVADRVALKLGDYVVTESGFGVGHGDGEVPQHRVPRRGLSPSAVVLVATAQGAEAPRRRRRRRAGRDRARLREPARGISSIVPGFGLKAVVAVNRFPGDTDEEVELVRRLALEHGAHAAELNEGVRARRRAARRRSRRPSSTPPTIRTSSRSPTRSTRRSTAKIDAIAKRVYGAAGVVFLQTARDKIRQYSEGGLDRLPICMAKTHLSLSHDPELTNAPTGFEVTVRDLRAYTGAGWIVALCGTMQTMPGPRRRPGRVRRRHRRRRSDGWPLLSASRFSTSR